MTTKGLSVVELKILERSASQLDSIPGCHGSYASSLMMGGGVVILGINQDIAVSIWEAMGMPKDNPQSAYSDVLQSTDLHLTCTVFRGGGFFSRVYVSNLSISLGNGKEVKFGSTAARSIPKLMEQVRRFLIGKGKVSTSTDEALASV